MKSIRLWAFSPILVLALGTLWVGFDGRHYWHDIRFLYACSQFSLSEVLAGTFNPHQAWAEIDELGSGGFYASKLLHLWLLHSIYDVLPPARGGLEVSIGLLALLMLAAVAASYFFFLQLTGSSRLSVLAASCVLLAPVTPYLIGKLLSESTSFLLATLSLCVIVRGHRATGFAWPALAGVLLALAALARLDSIVGVLGFLVAGALVKGLDVERRTLIRQAAIVLAAAAFVYVGTFLAAGLPLSGLQAYLGGFVDAPGKPALMSVSGVLSFAGLIYVLAILALSTARKQLTRFLVVWLLLAWTPIFFIVSNYMVEPRYLIAGLLPLAGLGAFGLDRLRVLFASQRARLAASLIGAVSVLALNSIVVGLMPYELDRHAISRIIRDIREADREAVVLFPWAYTDFHFVQVMYPGVRSFNVHSPDPGAVSDTNEDVWKMRFRSWYGDRYLESPEELHRILSEQSVYYVGWNIYPPLENARLFAQHLGFTKPLTGIGSFTNHLEQSWVWKYDKVKREFTGRRGQYEYYRIHKKD